MWSKFVSSFKNSVTIVWARLLVLAGALMQAIPSIMYAVSDPTIAGQIKSLLPSPSVASALMAIGIITEICRRRTV